MTAAAAMSERKIVMILAAVNFINILDFMIVMPLGPDFATALGIPLSRLGLVGGAYTGAAAIAGLSASSFLDRFDRRRALAVCLFGLVLGTVMGAAAQGFSSLLAARILAGAFGGPASALSLSILSDVVPVARRGKAMGAVMGAFAAASVLGVPAGLELARLGGWRAPFLAVAALGVVVIAVAMAFMSPMRGHLTAQSLLSVPAARNSFWSDVRVRLSLLATALAFMGTFALIPHLATYLQYNLGYPRERLGILYLVGGVVSFAAMRLGGVWVDRHGPNVVTFLGSGVMVLVLTVGFWPARPPVPVLAIFVSLMLANSLRSVALNTVSSKVPDPANRARFMSLQSAVQHMAAALGAGLSSLLLFENADHSLGGMRSLICFSTALALALPWVVWQIDRRLRTPAGAALVAPG